MGKIHLDRFVIASGGWDAFAASGGDRASEFDRALDDDVRKILDSVRTRGDSAVAEWTERFDQRSPNSGGYEYSATRRAEEAAKVAAPVSRALAEAAGRIRAFHEPQLEKTTGYVTGGGNELRSVPLGRAGLYVPGGTALYPSSVLMTAIPAQVAGVGELIMVTPGASPETLLAAELAGVHRVFEIGGAQAVAALAYGTETVPRVDKIVGPGNRWVAAAKRLVFGHVDIDSIAGPSEVLIIADESARADWVAADLLAQAEHDPLARPILVTTHEALVDLVDAELTRQLADLPRQAIAASALDDFGAALLVDSKAEAIAVANRYAPEHLELLVEDAEEWVGELGTAGAIFVGPYTPEAAGDYVAGPNHVLPTAGAARFASPLGVYDFRKYISILRSTEPELRALSTSIRALAEVEGLHAHARSVAIRFEGEGK